MLKKYIICAKKKINYLIYLKIFIIDYWPISNFCFLHIYDLFSYVITLDIIHDVSYMSIKYIICAKKNNINNKNQFSHIFNFQKFFSHDFAYFR